MVTASEIVRTKPAFSPLTPSQGNNKGRFFEEFYPFYSYPSYIYKWNLLSTILFIFLLQKQQIFPNSPPDFASILVVNNEYEAVRSI